MTNSRPAPAVGQVWMNHAGEEYLIACDEHGNFDMFNDGEVVRCGSLDEAGPSLRCTYVGEWTGKFPTQEDWE